MRLRTLATTACLCLLVALMGAAIPASASSLTTLVPESGWRYNNSGADLGTSWRSPTYGDSNWPQGKGEMGYGDGDESTNIGRAKTSAYFRGEFNVDNPSTLSELNLRLRRDDGAVVYLNGTEVSRSNMPSGVVRFATWASKVDPWDGKQQLTIKPDRALLRAGKNVLAVEIHQAGNSGWMSRDVTFRASLTAQSDGAQTPPAPPAPPTGNGWRLVDGDEFAGSSVNSSKWRVYDPANGMGNYGTSDRYVLACLSKDNVSVGNGVAVIRSKKRQMTCNNGRKADHTSGFLSSREVGKLYPLYGRYEIRARVPHGQGLWPAFWLRHVSGAHLAEVDILEVFHSQVPGTLTHTLHFPTSSGTNVAKNTVRFEEPVRGSGGWHTFAVDIEQVNPDRHDSVRFTFWVDGEKTLSYTNTNATKWTSVADKSRVWDIALNTAVGGTWVGHPDQKLGWIPAQGGRCSLERPQRATLNAGSCSTEMTPGRWYDNVITRAPSRDGAPDIWLAPWNYGNASASADYVIDYVRYFEKS